ncbi:MAG: AraC family transcriptional regulator of adaptative response [Paracoccaceae bacterium]|jgi:AraC family transcriptional regulator of adaptative response/methylated-DNA-[protein]-cysteine methyltransferase
MAQQQIETQTVQQTGQQKAHDFARIERALAYIRENFRDQPELDDIADAAALSPFHFQRLFTRWAGVSPKQFLGYLTLDHAKRALDRAESVLDAAYDAGLSGPSRLHDLFVNFEGITPGQYKEMGDGLDIRYGVHPGFLGDFVVAVTDRGICGLQFVGADGADAALADIRRRLPGANFRQAQAETWAHCETVFGPGRGDTGRPLRLWYKGTNFQIKVWQALLSIPPGQLVTYGDIARAIGQPTAARAVGTAVGANPIGLLIPCHRVIRSTDLFDTQYRWGTDRKLALIGWEQAQREAGAESREDAGAPTRVVA